MSAKEFASKVNNLWDRVQTNEESLSERKAILNECDELMMNPDFQEQTFLVSKVKLIMHKAGKVTDLAALIKEFDAELKLDFDSPDIYVCLAEAHLHKEEVKEALDVLLPSIEKVGEKPEVLNLISLCYRRIQPINPNKSVEIAKKSIALDMSNGKSWSNLGLALLSAGGHENILQASKALKCALKHGQDKNADTLMNLGSVSELLQDFMYAMWCYEEAMKIAQGWRLAENALVKTQELINRVFTRADFVAKLRPTKKNKLVSRIKEANEYIVVEIPADKNDVSQIAICLNQNQEIVTFGITKTRRAYIREEKTVLKIDNASFKELIMGEKRLPYDILDESRKVKIIGGSTPSDVPGIKVSSTIE